MSELAPSPWMRLCAFPPAPAPIGPGGVLCPASRAGGAHLCLRLRRGRWGAVRAEAVVVVVVGVAVVCVWGVRRMWGVRVAMFVRALLERLGGGDIVLHSHRDSWERARGGVRGAVAGVGLGMTCIGTVRVALVAVAGVPGGARVAFVAHSALCVV